MNDLLNRWEELGGSFQANRMHYKGVTCGAIQGESLVGPEGDSLRFEDLDGLRDRADQVLAECSASSRDRRDKAIRLLRGMDLYAHPFFWVCPGLEHRVLWPRAPSQP